MLDIRSEDKLIPGETCQPAPALPRNPDSTKELELPFCPISDNSDPSPLNIRQFEEKLIPGLTCKPLPICPEIDSDSVLDIRSEDKLIPGETCQPVKTKSSKPLPICPDTLLDIRSGEKLIPGETCQPEPALLPECPPESCVSNINPRNDGILIPGLTCICPKISLPPQESVPLLPGSNQDCCIAHLIETYKLPD